MNATLEFAQELTSDLEKLAQEIKEPEEVAERVANSLDAARQAYEYLSEAAARAHVDRPFLWARRVTNATAAAMSAASALVSAQNLCGADDQKQRQRIRDIEMRLRELNARILAEPRPVVPGASLAPPATRPAAEPSAPSQPVVPCEPDPAPEAEAAERSAACMASTLPERTPQAAEAPNLTIAACAPDSFASRAAAPRSIGNAALDQPADRPTLTLSEWSDVDAEAAEDAGPESALAASFSGDAAFLSETAEESSSASPAFSPAAPRGPWLKPTPARARALSALIVVALAVGLAAALAYPHFRYAVNKANGDRLGARVAALNRAIAQQKSAIAGIDTQISLLANEYEDAQSDATRLESKLTPGQRASSELADVQFSIASLSSADQQIDSNLQSYAPGVHDQVWELNSAKLKANQERIAELTGREKVLEAQVNKLAAPPTVVSAIAEADKRVEAINEQIRSKMVDRQVLAKSLAAAEQYAVVLRAEREKAYHPDR